MRLREKFEKIFPILAEKFPDPKSELNFTNTFQLLVAVMLSAQATDQSVNRATAALFKTVSTPEELLALGESELYDSIKSIGLAKTKARNIISTSQLLVEKYNSSVPDNFNDLISLPGVGSKTARVVLNVGFQQPTIAVDTHIFRVSQRLKLSKGKTPDQISEDRRTTICCSTDVIPAGPRIHSAASANLRNSAVSTKKGFMRRKPGKDTGKTKHCQAALKCQRNNSTWTVWKNYS